MDFGHLNGNGGKGQGVGVKLICTYWHKCCAHTHTHVCTHKMLSVATVESTAWLYTHIIVHSASKLWLTTEFLVSECIIFLCVKVFVFLHYIQTFMLESHYPLSSCQAATALSCHSYPLNFSYNYLLRKEVKRSRMAQYLLIHTLHFYWTSFQHSRLLLFFFFHFTLINQHNTICKPCDDVRTQLLHKENLKAFLWQSLNMVTAV